jgi:hypothetical protein
LLRYGLHLAATHFHLPFPYTPWHYLLVIIISISIS